MHAVIHVRENMYSYFWIQLIPLNTMVSSAVHFLQMAWFHSFLWLKNSIVCMDHIPFVWWTPSLAAFLGVQLLHIVSSAMKTWMYKYLCGALAQHPSGKFPREFTRVIWQFWCQGFEEPPQDFYSGCTSLHSHQHWTRVLSHLTGVKKNLNQF